MSERHLKSGSDPVGAIQKDGVRDAPSTWELRIRPDAPAKPAYGQTCNGCGVCCALEPCGIARTYIFDLDVGPCPALTYEGRRFVCGMTRDPGRYMGLPNDWADPIIGPMFAEALGIGRGCDASDQQDFGD